MITLFTGLPGHGKSLYAITAVKEQSEREGRPVFYHGITDLALPWTLLENPQKWFECPTGSIILIDECQTVFRPRGSSSAPPDYVSQLETHRHLGIDIFVITQHPMLIDSALRRLTERHFHICRRFGFARAVIIQFESCKDQPLAKSSLGQKTNWNFPKKSYEYYKSAELHTVKARIPRVYVVLSLFVILVIALSTIFYKRRISPVFNNSKSDKSASAAVSYSSNSQTQRVKDFQDTLNGMQYSERWRFVGWFVSADNKNILVLQDSDKRIRYIYDVKSFNKTQSWDSKIYLPEQKIASFYSGDFSKNGADNSNRQSSTQFQK